MKLNLGWKDIIYIVSLIGVGAGWFVTNKVNKIKNEMKDQAQDAKIEAQAKEISELKDKTINAESHAKENFDNIVWIFRILELDVE